MTRRLGVDLVNPTSTIPPVHLLRRWMRKPAADCSDCSGVGAVYGERGLFRYCPCRVVEGAPEVIVRFRQEHLWELF